MLRNYRIALFLLADGILYVVIDLLDLLLKFLVQIIEPRGASQVAEIDLDARNGLLRMLVLT
jgi:hypothetical protein